MSASKVKVKDPLPGAASNNCPGRKHYSHEPYRRVKTGLNTATAIRLADSRRVSARRESSAGQRFPAIIFRDRDLRLRSYLENLRNEYMAMAITTIGQVKTLSAVCD